MGKKPFITFTEGEIDEALKLLQDRLQELTAFFKAECKFQTMVYELWNAKDILGHITFWHESFARNISDLGNGIKPTPLKGKLSEVNQASVETTKKVSIESLLTRISEAQQTVEVHIHNPSIQSIPYKKGSRDYSRLEHLQIVEAHIKKHLRDLKKKLETKS